MAAKALLIWFANRLKTTLGDGHSMSILVSILSLRRTFELHFISVEFEILVRLCNTHLQLYVITLFLLNFLLSRPSYATTIGHIRTTGAVTPTSSVGIQKDRIIRSVSALELRSPLLEHLTLYIEANRDQLRTQRARKCGPKMGDQD